MSKAPDPVREESEVRDLAVRLGARLGRCPGIAAVTLGGSWASGTAGAGSDVDLGLYLNPRAQLDLEWLRRLARELDDRDEAPVVVRPGEWGPWVNGGAWLTIGGRRVDWIYRDLDRVTETIEDLCAGRPETHWQAGHPGGFSTVIYAGEIHLGEVLYDTHGVIAPLKRRLVPYPPPLRRALVAGLWEARFLLGSVRGAAGRGDTAFVAGAAFRSVVSMAQALFGLNERYWLHEKGALASIDGLEITPERFGARAGSVLGDLGRDPAGLNLSIDNLEELVAETEGLCSGR